MTEQLLDASAAMLTAARAGNWGLVSTLEAERSRLLGLLPSGDPSALETLRTLLAHNEAIRALAGKARDDLGQELGQHQHTHRALSAYLHTAVG